MVADSLTWDWIEFWLFIGALVFLCIGVVIGYVLGKKAQKREQEWMDAFDAACKGEDMEPFLLVAGVDHSHSPYKKTFSSEGKQDAD